MSPGVAFLERLAFALLYPHHLLSDGLAICAVELNFGRLRPGGGAALVLLAGGAVLRVELVDARAVRLVGGVRQFLRSVLSPRRLTDPLRHVSVADSAWSDEADAAFLLRSAVPVVVTDSDRIPHSTGGRTLAPRRRFLRARLTLGSRWFGGRLVCLVRQTVRVRTDPLPTAPALDRDHLGVPAVGPRRHPVLLRAQRRARVLAVLTRTLQGTVGHKQLSVLERLLVDFAVFGRTNSADASVALVEGEVAVEVLDFVAFVLVVAEVALLSGAHLATVATVFDDVNSALAAQGVVRLRTFAGVLTVRLFRHRRLVVYVERVVGVQQTSAARTLVGGSLVRIRCDGNQDHGQELNGYRKRQDSGDRHYGYVISCRRRRSQSRASFANSSINIIISK